MSRPSVLAEEFSAERRDMACAGPGGMERRLLNHRHFPLDCGRGDCYS